MQHNGRDCSDFISYMLPVSAFILYMYIIPSLPRPLSYVCFVGEWDNACNELQRMLIVRSLRPDRVSFCVTSFIVNNLGSRFVEPPVLDMQAVVEDSTTRTPLIFVLSAGVVSQPISWHLSDPDRLSATHINTQIQKLI
jgi:hypothetical protein